MNAREILQDVLLLDQSIILEFYTLADLKSFKSALQVYKHRMIKQSKDAGFDDVDLLGGRSILTTLVSGEYSSPPFQVKFFLGKPAQLAGDKFKIIGISDNETV